MYIIENKSYMKWVSVRPRPFMAACPACLLLSSITSSLSGWSASVN